MGIIVISTAVLLVIFIALFAWWWSFLIKFKALNRIPGPSPLPIIGNALSIGQSPQSLLANSFKFCKQYGNVFRVFIANEAKVFILDPDLMEAVLTSNVHITKSPAYTDLLQPWLGEGLLISTGDKWKVRRKMITPTFHFKILDLFLEVFNSSATVLLEKLASEVGKNCTDISPLIKLYTMDVICETAMGVKVNSLGGENAEYAAASRGYLDIFILRMFSAWQKFPLLFKLSPTYPTYKRHITTLHSFTDSVIIKRREKKIQEKSGSQSDDGVKRRVALLDMLLESDLSNEDIRAEIDTFMFEGHDTTSAGISFLLLALAEHQDVQDRVYDEIMSVTPEKNDYITMQHIRDMKYFDMVIKEVQRVYPIVPLIERKMEIDAIIGGYDFPKDTILTLYFYGMCFDEKTFPEPHKFDPMRFLPENCARMHNFAYVPFSAGPRNCIGQRFAQLEIKTTVIKILKQYKVLPVPGFKPDLGTAAVLKSYNGIYVKVEPRDQ